MELPMHIGLCKGTDKTAVKKKKSTGLTRAPFTLRTSMSDQPSQELDFLKTAICLKDAEIYALRGELDRRMHENRMLMVAIERLERTISASSDRLIRKLDRFDSNKRHKR